ncbi:MAG: hypothetical protein CM1200mP26_01510 [Acidimicrobiales bacterium]|nr:MAG: hypothetical protein CM1200mP26_01510 [Acidimicrobiales bacterium]
MFKRITSLLAIFLTLALLAGACGSDSADSSSSGSAWGAAAPTAAPAASDSSDSRTRRLRRLPGYDGCAGYDGCPAQEEVGTVADHLGDGSLGEVRVGPGEEIQIRSLNAISGDVAFLGSPTSVASSWRSPTTAPLAARRDDRYRSG